ncbi:hypothetical protein UTI89UKE3_063 [Escherichia phage vB_EcoP-UTI89UKE3]|uniref:Uncharacterized protein n=1 Tax=Escherichia phage vB_EcoP-UTI89UKE2 TaxID=2865826 RepID=A0AAE7XTP0_9CAUD|nr:hypothetical protein UTI89UKE2_063 [Escherichia phage vB_EcoP-UTI89UKE2]QZI84664.1 hypothetical protein UTI89UKE3_063 [Escherichia phage vB_EcoP-UTI89UKE3]
MCLDRLTNRKVNYHGNFNRYHYNQRRKYQHN